MLRHFTYDHLPPRQAAASKPFAELAAEIDARCAGPETTTALRKLLEAKDCAVRAAQFEARPPS